MKRVLKRFKIILFFRLRGKLNTIQYKNTIFMNHNKWSSIKCKSAVKYHISMYDMILNDRRYLKYSNTKMLRHFLTNINLIFHRKHPEFQISEVSHGIMEMVCYNGERMLPFVR